MNFKMNLDDNRTDRLLLYYERNYQSDTNDDFQKINVVLNEDPFRILLGLESNSETVILSSYCKLTILCQNDFQFPQDHFPLVLSHTLSSNPTLTENSQEFLSFLFEKHPITMDIFYNEVNQDYFNDLICLPFTRKTVKYLITIFKNKFFLTADFLNFFFDLFFQNINRDISTADFYLRLDFIRMFIFFHPIIDQLIYDKIQFFILATFPQIIHFDRDLLIIFLFVTERCANNSRNEEWLNDNIFLDKLLSFYSPDDNEINFYVLLTIVGISASKKEVSSKLMSRNLLQFFETNFCSCKDDKIQSLIIRIIVNLLICDDSTEMHFISEFIHSQLFIDITKVVTEADMKLKKELVNLVCYLIQRLKHKFFDLFIELNFIYFFIDCLTSIGSKRTKRNILNALAVITAHYERKKEEKIQKLLSNIDLAEVIDDFIYDNDQGNPSLELTNALQIQNTIYKLI